MCLICSDLMSSMPADLLICRVEIPFCTSASEIVLVKREMLWSTLGSLCLCELVVFGGLSNLQQLNRYLVCRNINMMLSSGVVDSKLEYGSPCFTAAVS